MGHNVTCLDTDVEKIAKLRKGELPIFEPGLSELAARNGAAGRLKYSCSYEESLCEVDICFLALPTPANPDGTCNLDALFSAVDAIAPLLSSPLTLVVKSTAPPGTAYTLKKRLLSELYKRKRGRKKRGNRIYS